MANFDVVAEIQSQLDQVTEIEEPSIEPQFGEQPVGKVTFDKTKKLYTISLQIARKHSQIISELDELARELQKLSRSLYRDPAYKKTLEHSNQLKLLSRAADYLFSISVRTEVSERVESELGIRAQWRIILTAREVEKYIPPGLKADTPQ